MAEGRSPSTRAKFRGKPSKRGGTEKIRGIRERKAGSHEPGKTCAVT